MEQKPKGNSQCYYQLEETSLKAPIPEVRHPNRRNRQDQKKDMNEKFSHFKSTVSEHYI